MNLGQYIAQQLLEAEDKQTIALFPGAFKPPHKGHFDVVKQLLQKADEVVVLVSPKTRDGVDADESVAIWELYKSILPGNVNYLVANENPVKETYNLITSNPEAKIVAAFGKDEFTRFNSILSNEKYKNAELFNAGTFDNVNATNFRIAIKSKKEDLDEDGDGNEYLAVKKGTYYFGFTVTQIRPFRMDSSKTIAVTFK